MAEQQEEDRVPTRWERKSSRVILIPVDGSKHSDRAFDWYVSSIMRIGDTVILFTGFELSPMQASYNNDPDTHYNSFREVLQKDQRRARAVLLPYEKKCHALEGLLRYKSISEGGHKTGELICKCVKDETVDMVIIGNRGMGKVRRTFLGSVSDYIVHHANIPVIIVPPAT